MNAFGPVAALARAQFGTVRNDQLAALGFDQRAISRRVRSGLLDSPYPGVFRVAGGTWTWRQELMAVCLWGNETLPQSWPRRATAVVSHEAAAALHGLDGFPEGPVVLTTPRQARPSRSAITLHRGVPDYRFTDMRDGIPVTNVARTLVDLAGRLSRDAVEGVLDDALRRRLVFRGHLRWSVETLLTGDRGVRSNGRRGAQVMHEILAGRTPLDGPSASAFQKDVRTLLLSGGLRIVEEQVITEPGGKFIARVDFALDYDVVVEAQSQKYHSSWAAQARDMHRHNKVAGRGKHVIYVTPQDVRDRPGEILAEVRDTVATARALRVPTA